VRGPQCLDTLIDVLSRERLFDLVRHIHARQRSSIVPLRIERLRIDFAERQVIAKPQQRLGQQHIVLGSQSIARRSSSDLTGQVLEQRQVIVLRIQSLLVTLRERAAQLFGVARVTPGRAESPARIELLDPLGECDAHAVNRGLSRSRPCIELSRNGLRERITLRWCRLGES
jgi:hypothetical protein